MTGRLRVCVGALVLASAAACGPSDSLRAFVPGTAYGVDDTVQAFRRFSGSRVTVWLGIDSCAAPIGSEGAWLTMSVPEDAAPGVFDLDPASPADPAPGTSTATVTVSEITGVSSDQATFGYVQIDEISAARVVGLADLDFPEGRFGVHFDAPPCVP